VYTIKNKATTSATLTTTEQKTAINLKGISKKSSNRTSVTIITKTTTVPTTATATATETTTATRQQEKQRGNNDNKNNDNNNKSGIESKCLSQSKKSFRK
jgi:hypothetical protein